MYNNMKSVRPGELIKEKEYLIVDNNDEIEDPSRERGTFVGYGNSFGLPLGQVPVPPNQFSEMHKNTVAYARFNPIVTINGNPNKPVPSLNGEHYRNLRHNIFYEVTEKKSAEKKSASPAEKKSPSPPKKKSASPAEKKTSSSESPYDYFDNFEYSERQLRNAGFKNTDLQVLTSCIVNNASSIEDVKSEYDPNNKTPSSPLQDRIYTLILMIVEIFKAMTDHDNAYNNARIHKQLVVRKRELQNLYHIMTDKIKNYEKELQNAIVLYQNEKNETKENPKKEKKEKTEKRKPRCPKGTRRNKAGDCVPNPSL